MVMKKESSNELTFINGFVVDPDLQYFIAEIDATKDESEGTRLLRLAQGKVSGKVNISFGTVAVDSVGTQVTVVGVDGRIMNGGPRGFSVSNVDSSNMGPDGKGWLRGCRRIGNHLYVVGMSRQVYRQNDDSTWHHIDQTILEESQDQIVGLNSIDGYSENEIYAAGLRGEIYTYDGCRWTKIDTPTNVQINGVRCTPEGVYLCGAAGLLLKGRNDRFSAVMHTAKTDNLYGIEWFKERLYVASLKGLFVLENENLTPVKISDDEMVTTCELHATDRMLLSIGAKHLFCTEDGVVWPQIFV